jgi:hypothetical protein
VYAQVVDDGRELTTTVVAYVRNQGTGNATLTITTVDWSSPLAAAYLRLDTDCARQVLQPDETHPLAFTLRIALDAEPFFGFNIDITSQGQSFYCPYCAVSPMYWWIISSIVALCASETSIRMNALPNGSLFHLVIDSGSTGCLCAY